MDHGTEAELNGARPAPARSRWVVPRPRFWALHKL